MAAKKKEPVKNKGKVLTPLATPKKQRVMPVKKTSPFILSALWVVMLILLFIPILNQIKKANNPVTGAEANVIPEKNEFTLSSWFASIYQKQAEANLKKTWAFKDQLTKFNNDLDYDFFNKSNLVGFVFGKDNYIYSAAYIDAYYGRDYIGEDSIVKKLKMARALQDTLKKHNIDLVLVYAPDKASFFPEYISSKYEVPHTKTNLEDFIKYSNQFGLNYIDLNSWFLKMKATSKYPLFPQYGHHWSFYGGCLAADSIIRYLSNLRHVQFPHWGWKDVIMSEPHYRDDDIWQKMNLSSEPPTYPMAYPQLNYDEKSENNNTRVLGVGDSYYRDFLMNGSMTYAFDNGKYWYYYNKVYPESDSHLLEVWELDLKKEIESNQVILILGADGSLPNFGWGFIEDAYKLYTNPKAFYAEKQALYQLNGYKKLIRGNPQKLDEAKDISLRNNITIDSVVTQMAREMMREDEKK